MIELKDIGYFKYLNTNQLVVDCIKEYPITSEIVDYLKTCEEIQIEMIQNEPLKIDGKLVVLI